MPANIGGIEATLETNVRPFLRSMDQADDRMDKTEENVEDLGESIESVGLKLAAVGAAISAAFGLAAKAADEEAQALGRLEAAANLTGNSFDGVLDRVTPLISQLELLGAGSSTELLDIFQKLLVSTGSVDAAMEALSLSTKLSALGMGDAEQISIALTEALAGETGAVASLDKGLQPVILKWQKLAPTIGDATAKAKASAEIFQILRERAEFAPSITPLQRLAIAGDRIRLSIGRAVTHALDPFFQILAGGLEILRRFSETGLGRVVITGTVAVGVVAALGGGLVLLGGQAIKAFAGLKLLIGGTGTLVPLTKTLGTNLLRIASVGLALEAGLQIGNVLNQWEGFRVVVQRVFAGLSFGVEKIKGFFGKGNQDLAQTYWDIASGKVAVGEDAPQTISLIDIMSNAMKRLEEAGALVSETSVEQIDINALLEESLKGLAEAEASLANAKEEGAAKNAKQSEEEIARQRAEAAERRRTAEESLMLQLGQHEEVLRLLEERRDATIKAISLARAFEGEARVEQLEDLADLNDRIGQLQDELTPKLVDPWEEAVKGVSDYGGAARGFMGALQTQANALADTLIDQLGGAYKLNKVQFGKFAEAFLKQMAVMIARALVLAAVMSLIPGASFAGSFGSFLGAAPSTPPVRGVTGALGASGEGPADDPLVDSMLRREGNRIGDLLLDGLSSSLAARDTGSSREVAGRQQRVGRGVNVQPVVEVHEATPQTWWQISDRFLEDHLRERDEARTSES